MQTYKSEQSEKRERFPTGDSDVTVAAAVRIFILNIAIFDFVIFYYIECQAIYMFS